MAIEKELEFNLPGILRDREDNGLVYFLMFLKVTDLDFVRGKVRVTVSSEREDVVKRVASKANFQLVE